MLDRHDSFSQPLSLRQIMDRLVEHAFVPPPGPAGQMGSAGGPALAAYEEGDHFVVEAQLPGMKPEDIDVSIERSVLTIRGDMKAEDVQQERNYLIREHRAGRFSRSLRLSETVDQDAVGATYEDGVLRLTLPKAERVKAHRVQIEAGDGKSVGGVRGTGQATRRSGKSGASGRTS